MAVKNEARGYIVTVKKRSITKRFFSVFGALFSKGGILFLICALLSSIFFLNTPPPIKHSYKQHIDDVVAYFYSKFSYPIHAISIGYNNVFDHIVKWHYGINPQTIDKHNISITHENKLLLYENAQLRKSVDFVIHAPNYNKTVTRITYFLRDKFQQNFVINVGQKHGISIGSAVANEKGLIGLVYDVGEYSARVMPITNKSCKLPALILGTNQQVIVGGTEEGHFLRIYYDKQMISNTKQYIENNEGRKPHSETEISSTAQLTAATTKSNLSYENLAQDMDVITSGIASGNIPYGLEIGRIKLIANNTSNQKTIIIPSASSSDSNIVIVYHQKHTD
jgi:cell shape-determining protein MreC